MACLGGHLLIETSWQQAPQTVNLVGGAGLVGWVAVRGAGRHGRRRRVAAVAIPGDRGSRVDLHRHWLVRTKTWRVFRRLLVRMMRVRLRTQAQGIAQACPRTLQPDNPDGPVLSVCRARMLACPRPCSSVRTAICGGRWTLAGVVESGADHELLGGDDV